MIRPAALVAALFATAPALAQDFEEPSVTEGPNAIDVTLEVNLLSDYRFRGISRSDEDPAVQAALLVFHDSGPYAGVRATTLRGADSWRMRDLGDVQLDLFAGYTARLGGGFEVDAGVVYYLFPGGKGATDYVEPYASLSYLIGPALFTAGAKYAPPQRAIGDEAMLYLYGQVDVTVPFRPWAFSAQIGRQDSAAFGDYWTWSLGVQHQLQIEGIPDTEIGLSYVDTSLRSASGRDAGLVLTLGLRF